MNENFHAGAVPHLNVWPPLGPQNGRNARTTPVSATSIPQIYRHFMLLHGEQIDRSLKETASDEHLVIV